VFDARRTLLIEDSVAVLTAGTACGVEHMLAIRQPDSSRPPRDIAGFPAVNGVAELI
jgi:putative hydrolase of the HAD superfamily